MSSDIYKYRTPLLPTFAQHYYAIRLRGDTYHILTIT